MEIEFVRIDPDDIDPNYVEVWNCEHAFELICPRKWEALKETDSPDIRYCGVCHQDVFLCESAAEFVRQGEMGRCVAVGKQVRPGIAFAQYLGKPSRREVKQMEGDQRRVKAWWEAVFALNPMFNLKRMDELRVEFERIE